MAAGQRRPAGLCEPVNPLHSLSSQSLLILGAGGHAKVLAETALAAGIAAHLAFLDDRSLGPLLGWPVLGPLALARNPELLRQWPQAAVAIGHAATRLRWLQELAVLGYSLPVIVHPSAVFSPSAVVGPGSVLFSQAVLQSAARLGHGVILNTACSVDHDCQLADGVHICPGAHIAGEVEVGAHSWIGIGASVIQQIQIGADVTVGAGPAVVSHLPAGVTAVGVPARVLAST